MKPNFKTFTMSAVGLGYLLSTPICAQAAPKQKNNDKRPNLLFIMTDQQRFDALGVAGVYPFLKTPNIDKLARTGVYFKHAYTPCPLSSPARGAILTGELVENSGVYSNEFSRQPIEKNEFTTKPTFDKVLVDNGYYAEYQGKWHCPINWTEPYEGFEWKPVGKEPSNKYEVAQLKNFKSMMAEKYSKQEYKQGVHLHDRHNGAFYTPTPIDIRAFTDSEDFKKSKEDIINTQFRPSDNHGLLHIEDDDSETAYQTKHAIEAVKRASKLDQPFNITLSIHYPHPPMLPSPRYFNMYRPEDMPIENLTVDNYVDSPYSNPLVHKKAKNQYGDPELVKYMMSSYFGLVTEIDDWVGKLLDTVEKEGMMDNTMIVFTSDHGEMMGDHALSGKGNFYEEACRVPFIINFPKVIKPRVVTDNVSTRDLYATILDYLNIEQPVKVDSRTLRPLIEGGKRDENIEVVEWLSGKLREPSHAIIKDRWKLILHYSPKCQLLPALYDADSQEVENFIGPSHPKREEYLVKAKELQTDLVEWLDERGSKYSDSIKALEL